MSKCAGVHGGSVQLAAHRAAPPAVKLANAAVKGIEALVQRRDDIPDLHYLFGHTIELPLESRLLVAQFHQGVVRDASTYAV